MSTILGSAELESFQRAVGMRLGLRFEDGRLTYLAEVLARRIEARGIGAASYLGSLYSEREPPDELSALARELTVGETYFFRHADQFAALSEVALPERLAARAATRTLRLLSAGCASGEEAYSLAILLKQRGIEPGYRVTIQGLDLNPDSLEKAACGVYSPWSLRETPAAVRQHWFTPHGRDFRLDRSVREAVRFDQHNLISSAPTLIPPGSFDIIFCRNVLMYFATEHASAIVAQFARALAPGGFLFLGHAETLRGLSHEFHLRHAHNAFYYQVREQPWPRDSLEPYESPAAPRPPAAVGAVPSESGNWVGSWLDAVERSSDRILQLSKTGAAIRPQTIRSEAPAARDLSQPLALLQSERFGEALAVMQQLSPAQNGDPAALLLRAALLTHQGEIALAETACHDLIRLDDLSAGAHYLLALCLERRNENDAAIEHDRIAVYLDSGFAMPHLHLGLMARRRSDADSARHELGQALSLLEREESSRLLLFGGGFSRAALLALCRSELSNLTVAT